ncbi:hypothetical protein [Odoribacter laneus]|jgi:hypothetical protein|uniref:Uncharacterized protein n=1 Tax=Odoribacter laneus YIT 12061 TaxID=742817 RepID=H1DGC8_9BACT|nr:hypothetical protein [Odoribacter laneus]EHP48116.1 hypothetical protein HMPREF9449_01314 [Odoribacter laneus YIT 12061]
MKYNYDSYRMLILVNQRLTKQIFLHKINVKKGSSAEELFSRMYDWLFSEAKFIEHDFEKYYKVEYNNFEDFLLKRYCVDKEIIKEFMSMKAINKDYILIDVDVLSYGDTGFMDLVFSEENENKFINLLLLNENENQA